MLRRAVSLKMLDEGDYFESDSDLSHHTFQTQQGMFFRLLFGLFYSRHERTEAEEKAAFRAAAFCEERSGNDGA